MIALIPPIERGAPYYLEHPFFFNFRKASSVFEIACVRA